MGSAGLGFAGVKGEGLVSICADMRRSSCSAASMMACSGFSGAVPACEESTSCVERRFQAPFPPAVANRLLLTRALAAAIAIE